MIEIAEFKPEEIDDTIEALDTLQGILVPFFKKMNFEGLGEQDAQDFVRSITLAKHALIAMGDFLEKKIKGVDEVKELATLRAERDAAVRDLAHLMKCFDGAEACLLCEKKESCKAIWDEDNPCKCAPKWRGPQQEET